MSPILSRSGEAARGLCWRQPRETGQEHRRSIHECKGTHRYWHDSSPPEPGAINGRFPTRFSRLIKRMLVQQHLNFIEETAPDRIIRAEWQRSLMPLIGNIAEQMRLFRRRFVTRKYQRSGRNGQKYYFYRCRRNGG